jgi:hypothetical protein
MCDPLTIGMVAVSGASIGTSLYQSLNRPKTRLPMPLPQPPPPKQTSPAQVTDPFAAQRKQQAKTGLDAFMIPLFQVPQVNAP